MSAKFDEFPSLPFQDIKEKPKRHGQMDGKTDGRMDNVKTVYPPTNIVCGGYKDDRIFKNLDFRLTDSSGIFILKMTGLSKILISGMTDFQKSMRDFAGM